MKQQKRKTNIIKRKIRGGKKGIVKKAENIMANKVKQEEKNKKRIRNGKDGKNIDI